MLTNRCSMMLVRRPSDLSPAEIPGEYALPQIDFQPVIEDAGIPMLNHGPPATRNDSARQFGALTRSPFSTVRPAIGVCSRCLRSPHERS
jgi:hypothetical protein